MRWLLAGNNKNQQEENMDMRRQMKWLLDGGWLRWVELDYPVEK